MSDLPATEATSAEVSAPADGDVDHIIGVSFDKITRAEEVLLALVHLQQEGEIALSDAVVVQKDDGGKVRVHQTIDPTPGRSAMTGTIWGMLVGMLFGGPVFLAAAAVGAADTATGLPSAASPAPRSIATAPSHSGYPIADPR